MVERVNIADYEQRPSFGFAPAYLTINLVKDKPERIEVIVRSPAKALDPKFVPKQGKHAEPWVVVGQVGMITLTMNEFSDFLRAISAGFTKQGM